MYAKFLTTSLPVLLHISLLQVLLMSYTHEIILCILATTTELSLAPDDDDDSSSTAAIIGGVVTIILITVVATASVIIAISVLKNCSGKFSTGNKYVPYQTRA